MENNFQINGNHVPFTHKAPQPENGVENGSKIIKNQQGCYQPPKGLSWNQMAREGILPECLYCDLKFKHAGDIKHHLNKHIGLRPYKCSMCSFRHWYKTQMMNNHFVNMHGRKGVPDDIIVDLEEETQMEQHAEEGTREIREIQVKKYKKEPIPEKRTPAREVGAMYHDYKYEEDYFSRKFDKQNDISNQKPGTPPLSISKKIAANISINGNSTPQASNQNHHSTELNDLKYLPNANAKHEPQLPPTQYQYNPVPLELTQVRHEQAEVPDELKELPLKKLLNNDFTLEDEIEDDFKAEDENEDEYIEDLAGDEQIDEDSDEAALIHNDYEYNQDLYNTKIVRNGVGKENFCNPNNNRRNNSISNNHEYEKQYQNAYEGLHKKGRKISNYQRSNGNNIRTNNNMCPVAPLKFLNSLERVRIFAQSEGVDSNILKALASLEALGVSKKLSSEIEY